jgi:hypothetical protein
MPDSAEVMLPVFLAALFAVGLVAAVLFIVRRTRERVIARLSSEGLERRTGPVRLTLRFRDYRAPGWRLGGFSIKAGELVLTRQGLVVVFPQALRLSGQDLSNLGVTVDGTRVSLETAAPFQASGHVRVEFETDQAEAWKAALLSRGARAIPAA